MPMVLPERTVDAWTATYITGRRWRARLWATTERAPGEGYDLGVGLGRVVSDPHVAPHVDRWPDKVFALEHKGVEETHGRRFVRIRLEQHARHATADAALGGGLLYYVLPDPDWAGRPQAPVGTLPHVSARRTKGATWGGFQTWAFVAYVHDVSAMVMHLRNADPRAFVRGADGEHCRIATSDLQRIPSTLTLMRFLTEVRACRRGRLCRFGALVGPGDPRGALASAGGSIEDIVRESAARATGRVQLRLAEAGERRDEWDVGDGDADDDAAVASHLTFVGVGDADDQTPDPERDETATDRAPAP